MAALSVVEEMKHGFYPCRSGCGRRSQLKYRAATSPTIEPEGATLPGYAIESAVSLGDRAPRIPTVVVSTLKAVEHGFGPLASRRSRGHKLENRAKTEGSARGGRTIEIAR